MRIQIRIWSFSPPPFGPLAASAPSPRRLPSRRPPAASAPSRPVPRATPPSRPHQAPPPPPPPSHTGPPYPATHPLGPGAPWVKGDCYRPSAFVLGCCWRGPDKVRPSSARLPSHPAQILIHTRTSSNGAAAQGGATNTIPEQAPRGPPMGGTGGHWGVLVGIRGRGWRGLQREVSADSKKKWARIRRRRGGEAGGTGSSAVKNLNRGTFGGIEKRILTG
ncbi:MAG: hypothetical protein EA422_11745 [Gemmatimonadales bacterium]|nr:MAG: hypothetical protein EA422_11745 [Gemmatimonadales bacterium]